MLSIYRFTSRHAISLIFCLIATTVLIGSGASVASSRGSATATLIEIPPAVATRERAETEREPQAVKPVKGQPDATALAITVNRTDDIAPRAVASTCNGVAGDCTLREAVIKANNNAGADTISVPAGTYTLSQTGADPAEDFAAYGDVDIRESVTITGAGSGSTIIQAGAVAYGGIDKIFAVNPDCSGAGTSIAVTITGVTLQNGHNAGPFNNPQFNHTGGAVDFCSGGSGANALTLTDVIFKDNQVDQGAGGGLNVVGTSTGTTTLNISNCQFLNNKTIDGSHVSTGGGANITLNTSATAMDVTISNCTFDNNQAAASNGGGLFVSTSITAGHTGTLQIHNCKFTNNLAKGFGGGLDISSVSAGNGVIAATIDQETIIKNNVTGANSGTSFGGGIHIDLLHPTTSLTISKTTIINNSESSGASTKLGGGGIGIANAAGSGVTIQYCRIEGNTAITGSGLRKDSQAGTVTATNNWWGCSSGPSATPCDTAVLVAGAGSSLTTSPFLRIKTTPSPGTIIVNQTSAMTARVQDSTGADTAVSNLDVFVNSNAIAGSPLGVIWSAVGGTLSGQQATLQSSGGFAQATATYTGTAANASNAVAAKVDNDSTVSGTNVAAITVNKGNTTAAITSDPTDPSALGQTVTVGFHVAPSNTTASPTAPSGNVQLSDGSGNTCTGSINASGDGSCNLTLNSAGMKTLTATYLSDSNFNASPASTGEPHTVNKGNVTVDVTTSRATVITGQAVTFTATVTSQAPANAISPVGAIQFKDNGSNIGSAVTLTGSGGTLTAQVMTSFATGGNHAITADYTSSDANFNNSTGSALGGGETVNSTVTWDGSTDANWNTATNWTTDAAPTASHDIDIPASGVTNNPTISATDITVNILTIAAGRTLTVNSGRLLTANGSTTVNGVLAGAGAFTFKGNTLANNNSITIANVNFNASGQFLNGTGSFASTTTATLLTGTMLTLNSNMQMGSLVFNAPNTLDISSRTLKLSGPGLALGSTTALITTNSTVEFNGTAAQTVAGGTYNALTINNSAGATLNGNATANGTLALASGDLNTGAFTLTQPGLAPASTGPGDVIGTVKRTSTPLLLPPAVAITFGNPNNSLTFVNTGTLPSEVTINLVKSAPVAPPFAAAINRTYTITQTGGSGYLATVRLHYQDSELNGNLEGAMLNLFRYDGVNWHKEGQTANDTTNNWVEKSGITQFSPWTMNSSVPTEARLDAFTASSYDDGTLIEWRTGFEVDNLGFRLYRDAGGKRVPVSEQLIAGSALVAGSGVRLGAGRAYAWWDGESPSIPSSQRAEYWLEAIDLSGKSEWHGPLFATKFSGAPPAGNRAALLNALGNPASGLTHAVEPKAALPVAPAFASTPVGLAAQPAVKIAVNREGWYRVTGQDLFAAGLDPRVDPRFLQLFVDGKPQPIMVIGENDARLDRADAIEFYGTGLDTASTDRRVYWLVTGAQFGQRIARAQDKGFAAASRSFACTVERRDRTIYFSALRNGDKENFFGAVLASAPVDQALAIQHLDPSAQESCWLAVALQGVTALPHRVRVQLNGTEIGELAFDGQQSATAKLAVSPALVKEGDNTVRLIPDGSAGDVSLVDYIRLTYAHRYAADGDRLGFTLGGQQQVTINGFSQPAIRVVDVTDPQAVQEVLGTIQPQKDGFAITVTAPGAGPRRLLAFINDQAARPLTITANQPSNLRQPANGANLLILARREFFASLEPLVALRQSEGLSVALIDVEDIYDEFSYGQKTPQAVKDFLGYARASWKKQPGFVLFAGDASYDPKNYLGMGDNDLVPTRLIDTELMEAASDDWFADVNDKGLAEMAVGRLPFRTASEAATMVTKLIGYESSRTADEAVLVADVNNGYDFAASSARLAALLPGNLRVQQINRGQMDDATTKLMLLDAILRGPRVVNYTGHGSVNLWSGNLLSSSDANNLNNNGLPLFVMMTCLNGYFHDAALDSLAESLLKAEHGGAVAVWASAGMTQPDGQAVINQQLYRLLFGPNGQSMRLGDATTRAKSAVSDPDIRRTWILFGDPSMRLR